MDEKKIIEQLNQPVKKKRGPKGRVWEEIQRKRAMRNAGITEEQLILAELARRKGKDDLIFMLEDILQYPKFSKLHYEVADKLKEIETETKKGLLLLPRGHLKSTVTTIGWTIQQIIKNPDLRILITSGYLENSKNFLREIKGHFEKCETLTNLYGDFADKDGKWSETQIVVKQRKQVRKEPTIQVASIDKSQVSQHYDIIIGDDIVNRENINTKELRYKTLNYYRDLYDLLEPGGILILIGTRWHFDDLYDHVIAENKNNKKFTIMQRSCWSDEARTTPIFLEKFSKSHLEQLRKDKGPFEFACTPAETPILMADLSSKPISEVRPGDVVMGYTQGTVSRKRRMVPSVVQETNSRVADVYDLEMESGRIVKCTKDHQWFTGRKDKSHKPYRRADKIKDLKFVMDPMIPPCPDESAARWLAGIFDGEGRCREGALFLSQARYHNPDVCAEIERCLAVLGLSWSYNADARSYAISGIENRRRFLHWCRPVKSEGFVDSFKRRGGRFIKGSDRVLSLTPEKRRRVYALTTETGNYIAWGYASKNCQYLNQPIDDENADFNREWIRYGTQEEMLMKPLAIYITIDPAMSRAETADYTGITVNGVDAEGNWNILRAYRMRLNPSDLIDQIFFLHSRYQTKLRTIGIEKTQYLVGLKENLTSEMMKRGQIFDIVEVDHRGRNKETRIRSLIPLVESGRIIMSENCEDLVEEMLAFPRSKHEDILDSLAYQIDIVPPSISFTGAESMPGKKIEVMKPRFQNYGGINKGDPSKGPVRRAKTIWR